MARDVWALRVTSLLAVWMVACASDVDPDTADPCYGCGSYAGNPGTDPGTTECVSDPNTGTTMTSDLSVLTETHLDPRTWETYEGEVELRALGTNGCWAEGIYDSSEPPLAIGPAFELGGLAQVSDNWLRARHVGSGDPLVPHITKIDSTVDWTYDGDFWMMPESVLDDIYAQVGVTRIEGRAHMLLEVVGILGPYAGAVVTMGDAQVAYSGGGWGAGNSATGVDGLALVMNVDAPEHPGDMLLVSLDNGQSNTYLMVAGYLTYGRVAYGS